MTSPHPPYFSIAQRLYAEKGAQFSLADIAAHANVSRPTIYKHLGNKEKILSMLVGVGEMDVEARIMRGVLEVAQAEGFKAATIDAIAEVSGVGPATIYRRFTDKEGLIKAFIERQTPRDKLPSFPPEISNDFAAQLEIITEHMLGFMHEHKTLVRLIFSGNAGDRAYLSALRDESHSTFSKLEGFFQAHQDAGRISAEISAALLTTNLFGMVHAHAVIAPSAIPLETKAARRSICALFQSLCSGAT